MRVAIVGYGVEGRESYKYWSSDSENEVVIIDERVDIADSLPAGAQSILGDKALNSILGFDLVVRTAGLSPFKIKTDSKVWSATNEFFAKCPAKIIGVTGSKGKGTTSGLIVSILKSAGFKVWFVGNIGQPALSVLSEVSPDDIVIYELSSFQLWDIEKSPDTAVVLHIEPDHLNVHEGMKDYLRAKANIVKYQNKDCSVIYNTGNEYATAIANTSSAKRVPYPSQSTAHVVGDKFYYGDKLICSISALKLMGQHNIQNALAAIDAVWLYTQDLSAIQAGLENFRSLPHRLAFVRRVKGVDYYDDSIATTPSSSVAALRAFPGKRKIVILGGSSKGSDYSPLAQELVEGDNYVLLLKGEASEELTKSFSEVGFADYEKVYDMNMSDVVLKSSQLASNGDVVLLSPAAASFGEYKDYSDRGNKFVSAVESL